MGFLFLCKRNELLWEIVSHPYFLGIFRKQPCYGPGWVWPCQTRTKNWAEAFLRVSGTLRCEYKPSICSMSVSSALRLPFTAQMVCFGPHLLTRTPISWAFSGDLHFPSSLPPFSWLPLTPGWKLRASPFSGCRRPLSALLHCRLASTHSFIPREQH